MPKFNIEEASQVALQLSCVCKYAKTIISNGKNKMKKTITSISLAASIAVFGADLPIQDGDYDDNKHLVVMVDTSGLNSYKCNSLFSSNKAELDFILDRRSIRTMQLTHLSVYQFDEQINKIGEIESTKKGNFRRGVQEIKSKLNNALYEDSANKAKDSIAVIQYLNLLASTTKDKVVGVVFSNMRNTTMSKDEMKAMTKIKLLPNLSIVTYSKSGLKCLKTDNGTPTASQILLGEASYKQWYSSKITGSFEFKTVY